VRYPLTDTGDSISNEVPPLGPIDVNGGTHIIYHPNISQANFHIRLSVDTSTCQT